MSTSHKIFNISYDAEKHTLNGVPLWMLFIDKISHVSGGMYFDTSSKLHSQQSEPGYHDAMTNAFNYVLKNPGKKLDAEEFKNIHHLCVNTVKNVNSTQKDFFPAMYGFDVTLVTEEAKKEWKKDNLIITKEDEINAELLKKNLAQVKNGQIQSCSYGLSQEETSDKVNSLIADYYSEIKHAQSEDEKLSAIVTLCRKLEIGHFFADGNQRTIVFVILNKFLIENGLSPTILDDPVVFDGYLSKNELMQAVKKGQSYFASLASEYKKPDEFNLLAHLAKTKAIDDKDLSGQTPLRVVMKRFDKIVSQKLLEAKANPDLAEGYTLLYDATVKKDIPYLKLLLEAKADPSRIIESGKSPISFAIENQHLETLTYLIEAKANLNIAANKDGDTPLGIAIEYGKPDIIDLLLKSKADPSSGLHDALDNNSLTMKLLAHRADPNITKDETVGSLLQKAEGRSNQMKELLKEKGIEPSKKNKIPSFTLLHSAILNGQDTIVSALIEAKADVTKKTEQGISPLELAKALDRSRVTTLLTACTTPPKMPQQAKPLASKDLANPEFPAGVL